MNSKTLIAGTLCGFLAITSANAQILVYDSLDGTATAGYTDLTANAPVFGDDLTLTEAGQLSWLGLTVYNSTTAGNTGSILTGTTTVNFYDNTTPYSGGVLSNPLIGTATVIWDFTSDGGLPAGYYAWDYFDLTSLNIVLPQNIFVTQQFALTSGTSLRNGAVFYDAPVVGNSPTPYNFYLKSAATPEDSYTFGPETPSSLGLYVEVVPEPSVLALALAGLPLLLRRRS